MPDHVHHFVEFPSVGQNGGYFKNKGNGRADLDRLRVYSVLYGIHCAERVEVLSKDLRPDAERAVH